nr:hypothetical protein [Tanacetum cinerariifolium]
LHCLLSRLWFIFHHHRKKRSRRWNLRSIIRHTTSSSYCFQITSRVSNGVARKSTQARSKGTIGVHKLGDQFAFRHLVFEKPELDNQELVKLEVGKPGVDKQERKENQEVEFDLTSSDEDSWYFLGCS